MIHFHLTAFDHLLIAISLFFAWGYVWALCASYEKDWRITFALILTPVYLAAMIGVYLVTT